MIVNYLILHKILVNRSTVRGSKRISTIQRPFKRNNRTERSSDRRRQRVNPLNVEDDQEERMYQKIGREHLEDYDSDSEVETPGNFLGEHPSLHSSSGK